jgi:hypothetical protein
VLFLIGAEIDYEITKLSSKFVFHNPNETDACGCGESVTIQPAAEALADGEPDAGQDPVLRRMRPGLGRAALQARGRGAAVLVGHRPAVLLDLRPDPLRQAAGGGHVSWLRQSARSRSKNPSLRAGARREAMGG